MLCVIYGTTGELIKIAPLLLEMERSGRSHVTVTTGQQPDQIGDFLEGFGLRQPTYWFARGHRGRDLRQNWHIPGWLLRVFATAIRRRRTIRRLLRSDGTPPLVVIHGDTLTTLVGAIIGRVIWGLPLAHVEAGYRTDTWREPFPEELCRRGASRLATINYASGPHCAENLRRERTTRGAIVDTGFNTIRDSVMLAAQSERQASVEIPDEPFGVVSLHRFELLHHQDELFRRTLEILRDSAESGPPLLFVDHTITAGVLENAGLEGLFTDRFRRIPRLPYFEFMGILRRSAFLVTDSGGNQQECWQLGHPCLVHRLHTEHADSEDGSVVVSRFDLDVLRSFLAGGWRDLREGARDITSPTALIVADLESRGHLRPAPAAS